MSNPPPPVREIAAKGTHEAVLALLRQEPGIRTVLDIPCGLGAFALRLQQLGYDVTAADVVPGAEPVATRFRTANMDERLPFDDGALDAVVCIDGIEHINRPYDFAAECARVVRPGGAIILSTPNISSLRSRWRWFLTGFHHGRKTPLDERNVNPLHHINMIEFHKMRYMLHRVGFSITAIATNRIKLVAWLYAPLLPFAWLMTKFVFQHEIRSAAQRALAGEVLRQMFTCPVLFGDACIVKAVRLGPAAANGAPGGVRAAVAVPAAHRSRWKSLQYFVLRHVLQRRQITAHIAPFGWRVRAYSRDVLGRHLFKRGTYERQLTQFVMQHLRLRENAVILDIGANLGWYSLLCAKRCPQARILALEPEPRNLALLRRNLEQNGATNVTVHGLAVAERAGTMQLYPYAEKNMGRHSLVPMQGSRPIDVPTVGIDEFLAAQGIDPEQVDFVKIDVEGYELPALRGARRLLGGSPVIVAEFAPKYMRRAGIDPNDHLALLRDAGFVAHEFRDGVLRRAELDGAAQSDRRLDLIWQKPAR